MLPTKKKILKYPKLTLLLVTIIIAGVFFYKAETSQTLNSLVVSLGYIGTFFSGFFYSYSFTAAPATALLLVLSSKQRLLLATLIGGFGALVSDIIIFFFIKNTFSDEFSELKQTKVVSGILSKIRKILGKAYSKFVYLFAAFLIATPLPSEVGIAILANKKDISSRRFMITAYVIHTIGIFFILAIGHMI